jgi:hypothetical protein
VGGVGPAPTLWDGAESPLPRGRPRRGGWRPRGKKEAAQRRLQAGGDGRPLPRQDRPVPLQSLPDHTSPPAEAPSRADKLCPWWASSIS